MKSKRIINYDILNIMAIIAVIFLHHNGIVHTYSPYRTWKTALIFETVFYWAVPVFVMLSGANLMDYRKKYDTKTFFKKRFMKVVIPFLFWSMFLIIWKSFIGTLEVSFNFKEIINIFFTNSQEVTYYFIFIILGIYLTMPVLSLLTGKKNRKILWYIVIVIFITKSVLPVLLNLVGIYYNSNLSIFFDGYLIFVILGYLLSTMNIKRKNRIIIYALGVVSCLIRYFGTLILSTKNGILDKTFFGYCQFHSVLLAAAVFIFIKHIDFNKIIKSEKVKRILEKVSSCSFGIYLIHLVVKSCIVKLFTINEVSILWRTFGVFATYALSLGVVYIMKKIPLLKKIVP